MPIRKLKKKITKRKNPDVKLTSLYNKQVVVKTGHAQITGILNYFVPMSMKVPLEYSTTYEVLDKNSLVYFYEKDIDSIKYNIITLKDAKKNFVELF